MAMARNTTERRALVASVPALNVRLRKRSKKGRRAEGDEDAPPPKKEGAAEGGETEESEGEEQEQEESEEEEPEEEGRGDGPGTIEGYAAVFHSEEDAGTEYELWNDPGFRAVERIARGAFGRAIKDGDDCRACFNHDPNMLLGRTASGTLTVEEDERGLRYRNDLPDTQVGRDVAEMVGRGDVTGSSFGFVVEQESWRETEEQGGQRLAVRTIESVRLLDVGPVTYPAYASTSAGRSASASVRAIGDVAEARASYRRWKDAVPLEARLAAARARAVAVSA